MISMISKACQKNSVDDKKQNTILLSQGHTTYYVDNDKGNNSNPGTSVGLAWKSISKLNTVVFSPGDKILLKKGGAWTGTLRPQGEGTAESPILIDSYGTGAKPIINGAGARDEGPDGIINTADDVLDGGAVILLKNQSYWSIANIEVTNPSTTEGNRQGIKIVVEDVIGSATDKIVQGIKIKGVTVRDVFGEYSFEKGKDTGGISLLIFRATGSATVPVDAKFDNILIEECEIRNMNRTGIFTGSSGKISAETSFNKASFPITNLIIRRNIVDNCTGDGIIVRYAESPLIESNLATNNHSGDESLVKYGVSVWCRSTNDAVFQFNEVYGTQGISADGLAFDADLDAVNTIFQYNYSHDNLGGFVLMMRTAENTIVRYNISQRDGRSNAVNRIFHFAKYPASVGLPPDAQIYNNSFHVYDDTNTTAAESIAISDFADSRTVYSNNIFYNEKGGIVKREEDKSVWRYNHFYNYSDMIPDSPTGIYGEGLGVNTNSTGNPLLDNSGSSGNLKGIGTRNADGSSSLGTQADGYKINSKSPLYQKGILISNNGGKDFFGKTVSSTARPSKGAHNGS